MSELISTLERTFSGSIAPSLTAWLPRVSVAITVLAIAYLAWRMLARPLHLLLKRARVDDTAASFLEGLAKYVLLIIGLVTALGELGINTGSLLASLGVAGLTIGFAARDALSNIISGLFIFWDRPFVIGDLVEIDGRYGRVDQITLRSTRVVTPDGKMLAIPNSTVVNNTVTSYTNFPHLRLDVGVTVGVSEDLGRVRALLLELVADRERFLGEPTPDVVVTALNDYNVALELQVWIDDEQRHVAERFALRRRVFEALTEAGVDMPFETLKLEPLQLRGAPAGLTAADAG